MRYKVYQAFDPYHKWLGILPKDQPPHHYRLLGLVVFESDPDVIDNAANSRTAQLQMYHTGEHAAESEALLNEITAARICLLDPARKTMYDRQLRQQLASQEAAQALPPHAGPGIPAAHSASAGQMPYAAPTGPGATPQNPPPAMPTVPSAIPMGSPGNVPNAIPMGTPGNIPNAIPIGPSGNVPSAIPIGPGGVPQATPVGTPPVPGTVPQATPLGTPPIPGTVPQATPVGTPGIGPVVSPIEHSSGRESSSTYGARRRRSGLSQALTVGLVFVILLFLAIGAIFVLGAPEVFRKGEKEKPKPTYYYSP